MGTGTRGVATGLHSLDAIKDHEEEEDCPAEIESVYGCGNSRSKSNLPQEETKRDSGLDGPAPAVPMAPGHADEDGQGDGAGEPEDHGDNLEAQGSETVEDARHVEWCEADICEHEQGPDRVEQHEVDAVRRPAPGPIVAIVVGAVVEADDVGCKAEFYYGEDDSHDMGDGDETEGHHLGGVELVCVGEGKGRLVIKGGPGSQ